MQCPDCGTENTQESKFCRECGTALRPQERERVARERRGEERPRSFHEKVELVQEELAGLDCGRCGYESCAENAEAIVRGESPIDSCLQAAPEAQQRIRHIVGMPEEVSWGTRLWRALTSVKLAIGLIAALAVLSIVGTLIPQGQPGANYLSRYGPTGYKLIRFFMVDQLFHSWYYIGLLALLGINTLACLAKRFRTSLPLLRHAPGGQTAPGILKLENSAQLAISGGPSKALERVREILERRGYSVTRKGVGLTARKHLIGRLGVDLFHASLLFLLMGALAGGLLGYEAFQVAHKGEVFDVPGADFQVRVEDLWTENYPDSSRIKDWYTKLTVIDDGRDVITQTIEVNHPMTYRGVSFYQSSFGTDWFGGAQLTFAVKDTESGRTLAEREVKVDGSFPLDPEKELMAKFITFYPDFIMTDQGPANRSRRLNNPAAFLEIYQGDTLTYRGWTFAQFPDMQIWVPVGGSEQPVGHGSMGGLPYRIDIVGMHAPEFTGLQISYNPGLWIIYLSFFLMVLGMVLNFYLPPRWVWVVAERGALSLGGVGRDNREFMGEFEALVEQVRSDLARSVDAPSPETSEAATSSAARTQP